MADERKQYTVVQESDIGGLHFFQNDTVYLTDGEARYLIGLSIEPGPNNFTPPSISGEHREKPIDVDEGTRIMKEPQAHEADDRSALRPKRSTAAPRP